MALVRTEMEERANVGQTGGSDGIGSVHPQHVAECALSLDKNFGPQVQVPRLPDFPQAPRPDYLPDNRNGLGIKIEL
jgi:hypothetical protein